MRPVRVLYLEDSEADAELVQALLDESGMACTLIRVESPDEFAAALKRAGSTSSSPTMRYPLTMGFPPSPATNAARVPEQSGVAQLTKMSVEELMDIEATSVSKRSERLSETASAIQIIRRFRRDEVVGWVEQHRTSKGSSSASKTRSQRKKQR